MSRHRFHAKPKARREKHCIGCRAVIVRTGGPSRSRAKWCLDCHPRRRRGPSQLNPLRFTKACVACGTVLHNVASSRKRCVACAALWNRTETSRDVRTRKPEQYRAQQKLYVARRTGRIQRPTYCQACAKDCKPHAHHFAGYEGANALKVIWLCPSCHGAAHVRERRAHQESA